MQPEGNIRKSEFTSGIPNPEKFPKLSLDSVGSSGRAMKLNQKSNEYKTQHTPHTSPRKKLRKTPRSNRSSDQSIREATTQLEEAKQKAESTPHSEIPEKIRKTPQSGRFFNELMLRWSKHTNTEFPLSQLLDSPVAEEKTQQYAGQERKIQILQKKLLDAEENISSLTAAQNEEFRIKEEILRKLAENWETIDIITKYSNYISDSLTGFQQHHANLSASHNNIITMQETAVSKLQEQLKNIKTKDDDQKRLVVEAENKMKIQDARIQELITIQDDLKKNIASIENKSTSEISRLKSLHAEEYLKLTKEHEKITTTNEKLQLHLRQLEEEKENVSSLFSEKEKRVSELQEEASKCRTRIDELQCQNAELTTKYANLLNKENEFSKQLQLKQEELEKLRENLDARQKIESDLAKDINLIEKRYSDQREQYKTLQNDLKNVNLQLKQAQLDKLDLLEKVKNMENENQNEVAKLMKRLEALRKENEDMLSKKNEKIKDADISYQNLQEKHDLEINSLREMFESKLSELTRMLIEKGTTLEKVNEALNKANAENQTLREKLNNIQGFNDKLQVELKERLEKLAAKSIAESEKREGNKTTAETYKITEPELKPMQNDREQNLKPRQHTAQLIDSGPEDSYSFNVDDSLDDLQKTQSQWPSILKQRRRIRFNLTSTVESSAVKNSFDYQTQSKTASHVDARSASQLQECKVNEDDDKTSRGRKFFKSRVTKPRQYTSQKKANRK